MVANENRRVYQPELLLLVQGSWVNQVGVQIALVGTTVWLRQFHRFSQSDRLTGDRCWEPSFRRGNCLHGIMPAAGL
jgi:hypothetical protein